ncbi:unnamed protein product, partial [Symbiodinium necroappetens]
DKVGAMFKTRSPCPGLVAMNVPKDLAIEPLDHSQLQRIKNQLPKSSSRLRACLQCRLIMTKEQFLDLGCPNCRDSLGMQENEARVLACTTGSFAGFFSLVRPGSFASRFTGLERSTPGCYALTVHGSLPELDLDEDADEYEPDDLEGEVAEASPVPPKGEASQQSPAVASPSLSEEDFDIEKLLASPMASPAPTLGRQAASSSPSLLEKQEEGAPRKKRLRKAKAVCSFHRPQDCGAC